jgi:hypothetical protein
MVSQYLHQTESTILTYSHPEKKRQSPDHTVSFPGPRPHLELSKSDYTIRQDSRVTES